MTMKKYVLKAAVLAAALSGLSFGANATTTDLGAVSTGVPTPFSGWAPVGSFIDDFTFSLPANLGSAYSVVNFPLDIPVGSFNTVFSGLALFSNPDGIIWNGDESLLANNGASGGSLSLSFGPTAAGSMILQVMGATNGSAGGLYSGAISVAAVPLPPAMMLFGGALMSLAAWRTRPQGSKNAA